jgi:hypothetical protein
MDSSDHETSTTSLNKEDLDNEKEIIIQKICPITKIFKSFGRNFFKFYVMRMLLSLVKKLFKVRFNIFRINPLDFIKIIFNLDNLNTGLFLSVMPSLFRFLNLIFTSSKKFKNLDPKLITFISGFISSLVGIMISEKANIMSFVILSVMVRSLHSLLVVWLKKKGYPTQNKIVGWAVLTLACSGVLFLTFYYPSYRPITNLVNRYSLFADSIEKAEVDSIRELLRLDK